MSSQQALLGFAKPTLLQAIQAAGLTSNLKVCLDAGAPESYTSGQKWLDISGNGEDFFLGADVNVAADDPAFTGNVGAYNAYWLFDGDAFFRYDTTNPAWINNLHKDNAILSIVAFCYMGALQAVPIFSTAADGTEIGAQLFVQVGGVNQQFAVVDGSGSAALAVNGGSALSADSWHMVGVSLNEAAGAGGSFLYKDGAYNQVSASDTFNGAYTTPSSSNATNTAVIGRQAGLSSWASNGSRISCVAIWEGTAITKANMDTLWALMRGRFGL